MGKETRQLLNDWHQGHEGALEALLERNLGWIRKRVSRRLGPLLRAKGETGDYVQDAMVDVLRYGPKFVMSDEAQFRALLAKIIENVLCGRHDWFTAQRRSADRERPMERETILDFDRIRHASSTRPGEALERDESKEFARIGISLLEEADREIILLRQWDELSYLEIGERLQVSENTARMRFERALPKLARVVARLKAGDIDALLAGQA